MSEEYPFLSHSLSHGYVMVGGKKGSLSLSLSVTHLLSQSVSQCTLTRLERTVSVVHVDGVIDDYADGGDGADGYDNDVDDKQNEMIKILMITFDDDYCYRYY